MTEFLWLPEQRKSRLPDPVVDPFPPSAFVRCTDDLRVNDLRPGQWTVSRTAVLLLCTRRGEYIERELGGLH